MLLGKEKPMQETLFQNATPIAIGIENIIKELSSIIDTDKYSIKESVYGIYIDDKYYYVSCDTGYGELNYWFKENGYDSYSVRDISYAYEPEIGTVIKEDIDQIIELDIMQANEFGQGQISSEELKQYYNLNLNKNCFIEAIFLNEKIVSMCKLIIANNSQIIVTYTVPEQRGNNYENELFDRIIQKRNNYLLNDQDYLRAVNKTCTKLVTKI